MVKNLPAMQETKETRVQSLGQEDPLEKGTTPQPSVLARKVLWTRVRPHVTQQARLRAGHSTEHRGKAIADKEAETEAASPTN